MRELAEASENPEDVVEVDQEPEREASENSPKSSLPAYVTWQNPLDIIQSIRDGEYDPKKMPLDARRACADYLRWEGYTLAEIGKALGINPQTVYRDLQWCDVRRADLVNPLDVKAAVSHLNQVSNQLYGRAIRSGRLDLAWKITLEWLDKLRDLGYQEIEPDPEDKNFTALVERAARIRQLKAEGKTSKDLLEIEGNDGGTDGDGTGSGSDSESE